MGNVEGAIEASHPTDPNSCIVEVVSLLDCPHAQALHGGRYKQLMHVGALQTSVYVRCCLSLDITRLEDPEQRFIRISEPVTTPKKTLEGSSEGFSEHRWSCFRDLQLRPLQGSYLTIEVCCKVSKNKARAQNHELPQEAQVLSDPVYSNGVDATADNVIVEEVVTRITDATMGMKKTSAIFSSDSGATSSPAMDSSVIGFAHVPIDAFDGEAILTVPLQFARGSYSSSYAGQGSAINNTKKYPNFSIQIRRAFTKSGPPTTRTIFLLRHGESRWNRAQDTKDFKGLLARDHPLTAGGVFQAQALNFRWRDFASELLPDKFAAAAVAPESYDSDEDAYDDAERITVGDADSEDSSATRSAPPVVATTADLEAISRNLFERACTERGLLHETNEDDDEDGNAGGSPIDAPVPKLGGAATRLSPRPDLPPSASLVSRISTINSKESGQLPPKYRHLRRQHLRKLFLESTAIYSSPLTRAVQTAYVALNEHPCIASEGIELCSTIREFKGPTGFDAIGIATGAAAVKERVQREMQAEQPEPFVRFVTEPPLLEGDAAGPWWTPLSSFDSATDRDERMSEFINFTRYCRGSSPIFVGHSLFFRYFCAKRLSTYLLRNRPVLASKIKKLKLANATLLAVTLQYNTDGLNSDGSIGCTIIDADLICGGGFHDDSYEEERLSERFGPAASEDVEQELARPSVFARFGAVGAESVRLSAREGAAGIAVMRQTVSKLFSAVKK